MQSYNYVLFFLNKISSIHFSLAKHWITSSVHLCVWIGGVAYKKDAPKSLNTSKNGMKLSTTPYPAFKLPGQCIALVS